MSTYGDIETGIESAITKGVSGSPFQSVRSGYGGVSQKSLVEELERYASGDKAPAALIMYAGGQTNGGEAGDLEEKARFSIALVASSISGPKATAEIYDVIDWVREKLHNRRGITGIKNPLQWMETSSLPHNLAATHAVYVMTFIAPCHFDDGDA